MLINGSTTNCFFMSALVDGIGQRLVSSGGKVREKTRRTVLSSSSAVNTQPRVTLNRLPTLDLRQRLDRAQSRVLRQRQWDRVKRCREGAHRVLLDRRRLVGFAGNGERAGDLGGSSTVNDAGVANEGADNTKGVVKGALGLVDDLQVENVSDERGDPSTTRPRERGKGEGTESTTHHLVTSPNEHRDSLRVRAVFNNEHPVPRCTEGNLADNTGLAELCGAEVLETGDDAGGGGDGDELVDARRSVAKGRGREEMKE